MPSPFTKDEDQDHKQEQEKDTTLETSTLHIKELLEIDKDVARVLEAASQAIRDLTSSQSAAEDSPDDNEAKGSMSLAESKQAFKEHTTEYFTLIQSLSERLHEQAHALEKAGIISAEAQITEIPPPPAPLPMVGRSGGAPVKAEPPMPITNGGLGNLDVGWLNSRRDVVSKQKEAELWEEARVLLERIQSQALPSSGHDEPSTDNSQP